MSSLPGNMKDNLDPYNVPKADVEIPLYSEQEQEEGQEQLKPFLNLILFHNELKTGLRISFP